MINRLLILMVLFCPSAFSAVATDIRISDNRGNVLAITADGYVTMRQATPDAGTDRTFVANDRRISDNDGDVLAINSDSTLTAKF